MIISFYPDSNRPSEQQQRPYLDVLSDIRGGTWKDQTLAVRALYDPADKTAYSRAKETLPGYTICGVFPGRRSKLGFGEPSGLFGIDLDEGHNPGWDLPAVRAKLLADPHTFSLSYSVGGGGLCMVVQVPVALYPVRPGGEDKLELTRWEKETAAVHVGFFHGLSDYLLKTYGLTMDPACKDVSRLRYVSYDTEAYQNAEPLLWTVSAEAPKKPATAPKPRRIDDTPLPGENAGSAGLRVESERIRATPSGNYHTALAKAAFTVGGYIGAGLVSYPDARATLWDAVQATFGDPEAHIQTLDDQLTAGQEAPLLPPIYQKRVRAMVGANSPVEAVAVSFAAEHGLKDVERVAAGIQAAMKDSGLFWTTEWNDRKGAPDVTIEGGELLYWLEARGFRLQKNRKEDRYFQVVDNVVTEVYPSDIRKFTMDYVETLPATGSPSRKQVREALVKGAKTLFSPEVLQYIERLTGEWVRDTASEAFLYFRNGWLRITKDGAALLPYEDLPGLIWNTQIKPHDFEPLQPDAFLQSDFHQFMQNITGNDPTRLKVLQRGLGYLLHGFKDVANTRALILMDRIGELGKSAGGTGKGLLMQAVEHLTPFVQLDGKKFNFDNAFRFEEVQADTRVVSFDEYDAMRLPFDMIFSEISSGLPINRKHQLSFTIPFSESPKFAISTNQVLTGEGSSHERRKIEVTLDPFYSDTHTPLDDFGIRFFTEWDPEAWNRFFNLAVSWLQGFLQDGILLQQNSDLDRRKLSQLAGVAGVEFVEFVEDLREFEGPMWLKETHSRFIEVSGAEPRFMTPIRFTKLMVMAGFRKEKCTSRADTIHYQHVFFLRPMPPVPEADEGDVPFI